MNPCSDEIYITDAFKGYGKISNVELLKYPIKEETNPDNYLDNLIRKVAKNVPGINYNFRMMEIAKLANGMRSCRV